MEALVIPKNGGITNIDFFGMFMIIIFSYKNYNLVSINFNVIYLILHNSNNLLKKFFLYGFSKLNSMTSSIFLLVNKFTLPSLS